MADERKPFVIRMVVERGGRLTLGIGLSESMLSVLEQKDWRAKTCALRVYVYELGFGALNDIQIVRADTEDELRRWIDPASRFAADDGPGLVWVPKRVRQD